MWERLTSPAEMEYIAKLFVEREPTDYKFTSLRASTSCVVATITVISALNLHRKTAAPAAAKDGRRREIPARRT